VIYNFNRRIILVCVNVVLKTADGHSTALKDLEPGAE